MPAKSLTVEQTLSLLKDAPQRIAALTAGLTSAQLHAAPKPGEWSVNDVLGHLRASAEGWGAKIVALRAVDGRPGADAPINDGADLDFEAAFLSYSAQRSELTSALESLPPEAWSRIGTLTTAGRAYEGTVLYYAEWMARHERSHVRQIERIVAAVTSGEMRT